MLPSKLKCPLPRVKARGNGVRFGLLLRVGLRICFLFLCPPSKNEKTKLKMFFISIVSIVSGEMGDYIYLYAYLAQSEQMHRDFINFHGGQHLFSLPLSPIRQDHGGQLTLSLPAYGTLSPRSFPSTCSMPDTATILLPIHNTRFRSQREYTSRQHSPCNRCLSYNLSFRHLRLLNACSPVTL